MASIDPMSEAHPSRAAGTRWDPGQYHRFTDHRLRPALDLLARVPIGDASFVCDLGCGPGNVTRVIAERFAGARVAGIDMSSEMLAKAAATPSRIEMLQAPESGGSFEYVPRIRGRADEKAIVAKVLDGDRRHVLELPFTAGTLLIFGGRQTLHRVTRVSGTRPRLVPVLTYAERPGLKNSEAVRKLFWGRTGEESA